MPVSVITERHGFFFCSKMMMEPLILVTAFFLLFLLSIIYVRLDFSITVDEGAQERFCYARGNMD